MNIVRHLEFFNPLEIKDTVHIIGVGAIGSHVAIALTRLGLKNFVIYDFDTVGTENIPNQAFNQSYIGKPKTLAILSSMTAINSDVNVRVEGKYETQPLVGYVFLCVDNIELRHEIAAANKWNRNIKAMFDFRMGLEEAQHYMADWRDKEQKDNFIASMKFTQAEAKAAMPVSACGTSLCVLPTIWSVVAQGIANFINFTKEEITYPVVIVNPFDANTFVVD